MRGPAVVEELAAISKSELAALGTSTGRRSWRARVLCGGGSLPLDRSNEMSVPGDGVFPFFE
jgi:hypothetical protein